MNAMPARARTVQSDGAGTPADPDARLHLVDALRGFALLGIFLVNIGDFALYWAVPADQRSALPFGSTARLAEILSLALVRGKFYTIFSFLFGLGFAMLLAAAIRRGADFRKLYRRRLTILLLIGIVHMTLIWSGDILTVYALAGFLLVLFVRLTDRALLTWAATLFVLPVAVRALVVISDGSLDPGGPLRAASQWLERQILGDMSESDYLPLLLSGDWELLLQYNLTGPLYRFSELLSTLRFPRVLGAFLLGVWVGRRRIFEDPDAHRVLLRRVLLWGLPPGLAANGALAALSLPDRPWDAPMRIAEDAAFIGVIPLALAYMAAFVLLWLHPFWRRGLALLAPAGRMALTNYLSQSVIGIFLFYGVGLGLGGRVSAALCAAIAVGVFAAQACASALWLRRFRYGPAEWLWRSLTYGERQAFRRPAPEAPGATPST